MSQGLVRVDNVGGMGWSMKVEEIVGLVWVPLRHPRPALDKNINKGVITH